MRNFSVLFILLFSSMGWAQSDYLGLQLGQSPTTRDSDLFGFARDIEDLVEDEEGEMDSGLCVAYGNESTSNVVYDFEDRIKEQGYRLVLEGIYGSYGNHVYEVYTYPVKSYIGAIGGIYPCR